MPERNTQYAEFTNVNVGTVIDTYTGEQIDGFLADIQSKLQSIYVGTGEAVPPGQTRFFDGRQIYNTTDGPLNAGRNGDGSFYAGFVDVTEGGVDGTADEFARQQAAAALSAATEAVTIAKSDTLQAGETVAANTVGYALGTYWKADVETQVPDPLTEALLEAAGFYPATTLVTGNSDTVHWGTLAQMDAGFADQQDGDDARIQSGPMVGAEFELENGVWQFRLSKESWLSAELTTSEIAQVGQRLSGSQAYRYQTLTTHYVITSDGANGGSQASYTKDGATDIAGAITQHLADKIHGRPGDLELLDRLTIAEPLLNKLVSHQLPEQADVDLDGNMIRLLSTDPISSDLYQIQLGPKVDGTGQGSIRFVAPDGSTGTSLDSDKVSSSTLELVDTNNTVEIKASASGLRLGDYDLPLPADVSPGQLLTVASQFGSVKSLAWSTLANTQPWVNLASAALVEADGAVSWRSRLEPAGEDVVLEVINGDQALTGFMLIKVRGNADYFVSLDPAISSDTYPDNADPTKCVLITIIADGDLQYATFNAGQPWS